MLETRRLSTRVDAPSIWETMWSLCGSIYNYINRIVSLMVQVSTVLVYPGVSDVANVLTCVDSWGCSMCLLPKVLV
jgi:hypothetical protein